MKKIFKYLFGILMLSGFIYLSSCEDAIDLSYEPYRPETPAKFTYNAKDFYPQKIVLVSDTPVFDIAGVYSLSIDSVHIYDDGVCAPGNFEVDSETGVITYNNSNGSINPGRYALDLSIKTVNSVVKLDTVYELTIFDVPVAISVDPAEVNAGALQQGVISSISYTSDNPDMVVESYAINPPVMGYSVNQNGEVVKSTAAMPNSTDVLSIMVNTNLGSKSFEDMLTVHVGPPPTILYKKAADGDTLKNVITSPTSTYSTQAPELKGMNSDGGWGLLLADTVPQTVKDALSVDADGVITFTGGVDIPDGKYVVGVKVTNATDVSYDFKEQFTITVVTKWTTLTFSGDDFSDVSKINYYRESNSISGFGAGAVGGVNGAKGYHGTGQVFNAGMILNLNNPADWDGWKMYLSFKERNGWNTKQDAVYAETARTIDYSYDKVAWNMVMESNDSDWPSSGGGSLISVTDQPVENIDASQSTIYFRWHYDNTGSALTKSVWLLADVDFRYTVNFDSVEE